MNIQEAVKLHQESLAVISEYFGDVIQGSVDISTEYYWAKVGDTEIWFDDEKFSISEDGVDANYSLEIRNGGKMFWEREEYSLAYVDNGCGQEFYILFDNTKKVV